MKKNLTLKRRNKRTITNRRKNTLRISKKKYSNKKKRLSLRKKLRKKKGGANNEANNPKTRRPSRESLFGSSMIRNSKFFISYLAALQKFNGKNTDKLRLLCNFKCDNEDGGFQRISYPDNDDVYGGEGTSNRFKCKNINDTKHITDYEYFEDHTGGKTYFEEIKYNQIFNNKELSIDDKSWKNLVDFIDEKFKTKNIAKNIVFGPAELLGPFTRDNKFYGLSHKQWTSNLNFNYIIHTLYLYGQILFVIPKYNNISSDFTNLSSYCNAEGSIEKFTKLIEKNEKDLTNMDDGEEKEKLKKLIEKQKNDLGLIKIDQFARATFNELILLTFLQDEDLIDIEFVNHNPEITAKTKRKIECKTDYTDKIILDKDIGECYYEIGAQYNNTKTQNNCNGPEQEFASCGDVETESNSELKNGVPYKFHIIIVKSNNIKEKFVKYNDVLSIEPKFPDNQSS